MNKYLIIAGVVLVSGCSTIGNVDTKSGRLQLVNSAATAVMSAQVLVDIAAANKWADEGTIKLARNILAGASITVEHAQEALASPACAAAQGDAIDTACGIALALQALGAVGDVIPLVQQPATASMVLGNAG